MTRRLLIIGGNLFIGIILAITAGFFLLYYRSARNIQANLQNGNVINTTSPFQDSITFADLVQAGFTVIKQESPSGHRFLGPARYFLVNENIRGSDNHVMIFIGNSYGLSWLPDDGSRIQPISIHGISAQEGVEPDNDTAINFIKGKTYAVIVGPNHIKIEKLAAIIADKIY